MPHVIDNYLLEDGSNLLLEDAASVYILEGAVAEIHRRGGIRWLREPDPEIREEKKQELVALIKPNLPPAKPVLVGKSPVRASQQPPGELLTAVQDATARMSRAQQTRTDRLLQQTGISLRELLILIE
jgi:hypothetical protein